MSWKFILAMLAAWILSCVGTYCLGSYVGSKDADAACTALRGTDKADFASEQTKAVAAAAALQRAYDLHDIAEAQARADDQQAGALEAQRAANAAAWRANQLTDTLKRLQNENADVKTWSDTCLPPDLLRSLHGNSPAPAGSPCR